MAHPNGYIGWLSPEIQQMILENLALPSLKILAETRNENKQGVEYYITKRWERLLRSFMDDVDEWINVMEHTSTVISGSNALKLVQAEAGSIITDDLDVYATEEFAKNILDHLKEKEGYSGIKDVVCNTDYGSASITKIYKLKKGEKKIDIIVTHWKCAITPILQFHTTSVMNYVTAHALVCLYPRWTCENKGFINPRLYQEGRTNLNVVNGVMKYIKRGFRISADPFRLVDHECNEDVKDSPKTGYCPHKLRSTVDEEVLRWNFQDAGTLGATTVTCENEGIMVWCLGGWECKDGYKDETLSLMFVSV
jgi:hypothetical protein